MKGYVVYKDRRYSVVRTWTQEDQGKPGVIMVLLQPFKGPSVICAASECSTWKRGNVRHINGKVPHRDRRPVHLDIDTGSEIIKARLKGKRKSFTCTFGGLYDLLARQAAINARSDRDFAKRTKRRQ